MAGHSQEDTHGFSTQGREVSTTFFSSPSDKQEIVITGIVKTTGEAENVNHWSRVENDTGAR